MILNPVQKGFEGLLRYGFLTSPRNLSSFTSYYNDKQKRTQTTSKVNMYRTLSVDVFQFLSWQRKTFLSFRLPQAILSNERPLYNSCNTIVLLVSKPQAVPEIVIFHWVPRNFTGTVLVCTVVTVTRFQVLQDYSPVPLVPP